MSRSPDLKQYQCQKFYFFPEAYSSLTTGLMEVKFNKIIDLNMKSNSVRFQKDSSFDFRLRGLVISKDWYTYDEIGESLLLRIIFWGK